MNERGGFTLVEVCLVGVVLAVLFAVSWPVMSRGAAGSRMADTASTLSALMAYARDTAVAEGRRYRLEYDGPTKTFSLSAEMDPEHEPGRFAKVSDSLNRARTLPDDIEVGTISPETVIFEPDGSSDDLIIDLRNRKGDAAGIRMQGANGKCVITAR